MSIFKRASEELERIDVFVELSYRGLGFAKQANRILDWLDKTTEALGREEESVSPALREAQRTKARRLEKFANEQITQGFPYLFGVMTTRLWTVVELLVDHIVTERLKDPKTWTRPETINSIKGALVEFARLSKDDQAAYLTVELRQSLHSTLKPGVGQFEAMLDVVGCGGSVPDEVRRVLLELQQVRHVITHRAGLVDRKLLEACPWIPRALGSPLRLSLHNFRSYFLATYWYVMELAKRSVSPDRKEYIQEGASIQNGILNRLRGRASNRWHTDEPASNVEG